MPTPRSSPSALELTQRMLAAGIDAPVSPGTKKNKVRPRKSKEFKSREFVEDLDDDMLDEPLPSPRRAHISSPKSVSKVKPGKSAELKRREAAADLDEDNLDEPTPPPKPVPRTATHVEPAAPHEGVGSNQDSEEDEDDDEHEASGSGSKKLHDTPPFPGLEKITAPGPPEFDYQTIVSNPDVDIFLIRIPPNIKPKYLDGLQIDLDAPSEDGVLGGFERKGETFQIRDVAKSEGVGDEMKGMTVLLRDEGASRGTHKIAPKPVARHLVITQSLSLPSNSPSSPSKRTAASTSAPSSQRPRDYTIASMVPPSKEQPEEFKYHFAPVGTWDRRVSLLDRLKGVSDSHADGDGDATMVDAPTLSHTSPSSHKKKRRPSTDGEEARPVLGKMDLDSPENKKKKRKSDAQPQPPAAGGEAVVDLTMEDTPAGERKKKKKRHSTESAVAPPTPVVPAATQAASVTPGEKKKKKKMEGDVLPTPGAGTPVMQSSKELGSEKKGKKRKHEEGEAGKVKKAKHVAA